MIPVSLERIQKKDIELLIAEQFSESKTIEFKRDLPGRDNKGHHELLSDVCAFANQAGGDIVYCIDEDENGIATKIVEIECNPDEECLRIQDIIYHGLEPKVSGLSVHAVPFKNGGYGFVLRVPQSWNSPHRVKTNQHFFIREGRRKRQLDISEIKTAFLRQSMFSDRLKDYRSDRLGKIIGGNAPVRLRDGAVEVLHIVPLDIYLSGNDIDVMRYAGSRNLPVLSSTASNWRLNLDGVLCRRPVTDEGCGAYTQLFRSGLIEAVRVFTPNNEGRCILPMQGYEVEILRFMRELVVELSQLASVGPILIFWSLINAHRAELGINSFDKLDFSSDQGSFDRQIVMLPDVLVKDYQLPPEITLKPIFDLIWNAAGIKGSLNYDAQGNFLL